MIFAALTLTLVSGVRMIPPESFASIVRNEAVPSTRSVILFTDSTADGVDIFDEVSKKSRKMNLMFGM